MFPTSILLASKCLSVTGSEYFAKASSPSWQAIVFMPIEILLSLQILRFSDFEPVLQSFLNALFNLNIDGAASKSFANLVCLNATCKNV